MVMVMVMVVVAVVMVITITKTIMEAAVMANTDTVADMADNSITDVDFDIWFKALQNKNEIWIF